MSAGTDRVARAVAGNHRPRHEAAAGGPFQLRHAAGAEQLAAVEQVRFVLARFRLFGRLIGGFCRLFGPGGRSAQKKHRQQEKRTRSAHIDPPYWSRQRPDLPKMPLKLLPEVRVSYRIVLKAV